LTSVRPGKVNGAVATRMHDGVRHQELPQAMDVLLALDLPREDFVQVLQQHEEDPAVSFR